MSARTTKIWFWAAVLAALTAGIAAAGSGESGGDRSDARSAPEPATPAAPDDQFDPPPCTGLFFADVTCTTPFDPWIEQYATDEITGGCGGGLYCPGNPVTRAQMAVFVEKAMRGTAGWSPGDLGHQNTKLGSLALSNNTKAGGNTAIGQRALYVQSYDNNGITWNSVNTAIGVQALAVNEPTSTGTGFGNTAVGAYSLNGNTIGFLNTAVGWEAGAPGGRMIAGYAGTSVMLVSNETGNYNTFIGPSGATTQVDNCTAVGIDAYCDATDQVRLGDFFVNSIGGKVAWSTLSDARAKWDVRELEQGLPLVLALRPVSYRYRGGNGKADMGFVAQDVEALVGDGYNLVDAGGDSDRTLSLRYTELIAPLVKAVQEQQALIEAQGGEIESLRAEVRALTRGRPEGAPAPSP